MRKWTLVVTLLAVAVVVGLVAGCQKSTPVENAQPGGPVVVTDHKVAPAEVGQDVVCPVMGTKFKVTADTLSAEYKGKVYYFCCPACPPAFKADPEKYAKTE
jgi:YHS domain-containing protein